MLVLQPGDIISNYRIEKPLGQGGMGIVYLATEINRGERVVIKRGNQEWFAAGALDNEVKVLLDLNPNHRSIPKVMGDFTHQGEHFLVMEYIDGSDLTSRIKEKDVGLEMKTYWSDELLEALEYLHENNIVHRDIKPQNALVTEQNRIYLVDFGLAKFDVTVVRAHTPNYASPEQTKGLTTDRRSDIYSMGATLYYLFTRKIPDDATDREKRSEDDDRNLILNTLTENGIPEPLRIALLKAMALDPKDRYASAAEMRRAVCLERGQYQITSQNNHWSTSGVLEAENPIQKQRTVHICYWNYDKCSDTVNAQETINILRTVNNPQLPYIRYVYQRGPFFCALHDSVPGDKLDTLLKDRKEPLPRPVVREWFEQLVGMLKHLHSLPNPPLRWTIAPSNLVIAKQQEQGVLRLWQYDLLQSARWNDRYAAPEEIDGKRTVRSDIYRVGAILYHLLTGRQPDSALDRQDSIKHNEGDPLQLDTIIDRRVSILLTSSLALEPENRFESISEMQQVFYRVPPGFWDPDSAPPPPPPVVKLSDLAALLYSFLAGKSLQLFESIRAGAVPIDSLTALTKWNPTIPPPLSDILLDALLPAPSASPLTFEGVLQRLEPLFTLQEIQVKLANTQTLVVYAQKRAPAQEHQLRTFQSLTQISVAGRLPLPADRALQVVQDIALALDSWHEKAQTPHGNVSPDTIWVNDAGNARLLVDVCGDKSTQDGSFTAPEQLSGEPTLESDRFALAAVAYFLLTAQTPPQDIPSSHQQLKTQIAQELSKVMDKIIVRGRLPIPWKATTDSTAEILARGMAVRPDRRYKRAHGLADIFSTALKQDKLLP